MLVGQEHHDDGSACRTVRLLHTVGKRCVLSIAFPDVVGGILDVFAADVVERGGSRETVDGAEDEVWTREGGGGDGPWRQTGGEIPGYSLRSPAARKPPV